MIVIKPAFMIDTGYLLFGKPNQFVTMHVWWAHYFLNLEEDLNFKVEFDFVFHFCYVFLWNCRFQRPPGAIPSSLLGLEAVTGSLDNFGFEDYLNGTDVFELWLCRTNVFDFTSCTFYKNKSPTSVFYWSWLLTFSDFIAFYPTFNGKW